MTTIRPDGGRQRIEGLSLGRTIHEYADQVGLTSASKLSDEANRFLPDYQGLQFDRNKMQDVLRDRVSLGHGLNEVQLLAIARALRVPETWLGVDPYASGALSRLKDLLIWSPTLADEIVLRETEASDLRNQENAWSGVFAGQSDEVHLP